MASFVIRFAWVVARSSSARVLIASEGSDVVIRKFQPFAFAGRPVHETRTSPAECTTLWKSRGLPPPDSSRGRFIERQQSRGWISVPISAGGLIISSFALSWW